MTCRLKTFCMIAVTLGLVRETIAADIRWNCFTQNGDGAELEIYWYGELDETKPVPVWAWACATTEASYWQVAITPTDSWLLVGRSNWIEAKPGDIASEQTTRNLGAYFRHSGSDAPDVGRLGDPIVADKGTSTYLMFMAELIPEAAPDYMDVSSMPPYYYGWVELDVGADGIVRLGASAIDLDGGPMIVGGSSATPEPSSAMLVFVGFALISLRSRTTNEKQQARNTQT